MLSLSGFPFQRKKKSLVLAKEDAKACEKFQNCSRLDKQVETRRLRERFLSAKGRLARRTPPPLLRPPSLVLPTPIFSSPSFLLSPSKTMAEVGLTHPHTPPICHQHARALFSYTQGWKLTHLFAFSTFTSPTHFLSLPPSVYHPHFQARSRWRRRNRKDQ